MKSSAQLPDMPPDERQRQENLKTHYADLALLGGVDFREDDKRKAAKEKHKAKKEQAIDEGEDDDFEDEGLFDDFGGTPINHSEPEWEEFIEELDEEEDHPTPRKPDKKAPPLPDQDTLHEEEDEE